MSTEHITSLDEKLLPGWRGGSSAADPHPPARNARRGDAAYRPGYGLFKLLLGFSLFYALFVAAPWSPLKIGSAFGMDAGGYVYLSIPLNGTEPRFEDTALRVDFTGAGLNVKLLEMKQKTGKARLLPHRYGTRDWRSRRAALKSRTGAQNHGLVDPAARQRKPRSAGTREPSATGKYLTLLRAYTSGPGR